MEPEIFLRVIRMREDGRNLNTIPQQFLNAHASDIVIS